MSFKSSYLIIYQEYLVVYTSFIYILHVFSMPSKRILRNQKFLEYYLEADNLRRKSLVAGASKDQINCLSEATLNVVNRNIPIEPSTKHVLCNHKKALCKIVDKKLSIGHRKKVLIQKGGAILPLILSVVLPMIANALFK